MPRVTRLRSGFLPFVLVLLAVAQQQPTFESRSNLVLIPTLVKDADGKPVYGLQANDFVIEDDGIKQPVHLDEAPEAQPVSLVIAIQRGGRASYEFSRMQGLSSMIEPLLSAGETQIAIVEFDSTVETTRDFTSDPSLIASDLKALRPGDGKAAILDALYYSEKMLEKQAQDRQRVLLLISETRDHGSIWARRIEDVVALIASGNTTMYALTFSPAVSNVLDTMRGNNIEEMNEGPDVIAVLKLAVQAMRKNAPKTIASTTGGEFELFETRASFESRILDFTNHLHSRYLLSFEPKDPHAGLHHIHVSLAKPGNASVLARTQYWAPIVHP